MKTNAHDIAEAKRSAGLLKNLILANVSDHYMFKGFASDAYLQILLLAY